jgi:uncharacterized protein
VLIDPFRFARSGEQLNTILSIKPDERLRGIIADSCNVNLALNGNRHENKRLMLEGQISGSVIVQCQVCLEKLHVPIDINFTLFPVSSEEQAERLQQEFEPIIITDNSLALEDLVTNELILSMSVTYSHREIDGVDCIAENDFISGKLELDESDEAKSSPFLILETIKLKDS